MRSLPIFGIGLSFALAGIALFAVTLRKPSATVDDADKKPVKFRAGRVPVKRSNERLEAERQTENNKMRIAGAVLVALGAALMLLS